VDPPHGRAARHDRALRARPGAHRARRPAIVSYGTSSYGYDIRCAPEFKVFTNIHSTVVDPKNFDENSFVDINKDVCVIPPNSFALARTMEYFRIPRNVLTICLGKSTYARCGIIVNVTPFEPEWEGYVTLEFSNTTPLPAKIYAGEGCAQVLFFESDEVCETSYKDRGGKYQGQTGVTLPKAWLLARSTPAEVIHVLGEVELWRAGGREPVRVGMQVGAGDRLSSGDGAAVSLRLADGSRVLLRPRGEMKLDEHVLLGASGAVRSHIRLNAGDLDVRVPALDAKRQLEVETPSAHLGVRGTEFRTHVDATDGGHTRLEVLNGQVAARALVGTPTTLQGAALRGRADIREVSSAGRVVAAGQGLRLAQYDSGPVSALLAAPKLEGLPTRVERLPLRVPVGSARRCARLPGAGVRCRRSGRAAAGWISGRGNGSVGRLARWSL
jgi:dCTP deaminase